MRFLEHRAEGYNLAGNSQNVARGIGSAPGDQENPDATCEIPSCSAPWGYIRFGFQAYILSEIYAMLQRSVNERLDLRQAPWGGRLPPEPGSSEICPPARADSAARTWSRKQRLAGMGPAQGDHPMCVNWSAYLDVSVVATLLGLLLTLIQIRGKKVRPAEGHRIGWSDLSLPVRLLFLLVLVSAAVTGILLWLGREQQVPANTFARVCEVTPKVLGGHCFPASDGRRRCKVHLEFLNHTGTTQSAESDGFTLRVPGVDVAFEVFNYGGKAFGQIGPHESLRGWIVFGVNGPEDVETYHLVVEDLDSGFNLTFVTPITRPPVVERPDPEPPRGDAEGPGAEGGPGAGGREGRPVEPTDSAGLTRQWRDGEPGERTSKRTERRPSERTPHAGAGAGSP
jgi:hypothetical protein